MRQDCCVKFGDHHVQIHSTNYLGTRENEFVVLFFSFFFAVILRLVDEENVIFDEFSVALSNLGFIAFYWVGFTVAQSESASQGPIPHQPPHSHTKDSHSTGITLLFSNSAWVLLRPTELSTFNEL